MIFLDTWFLLYLLNICHILSFLQYLHTVAYKLRCALPMIHQSFTQCLKITFIVSFEFSVKILNFTPQNNGLCLLNFSAKINPNYDMRLFGFFFKHCDLRHFMTWRVFWVSVTVIEKCLVWKGWMLKCLKHSSFLIKTKMESSLKMKLRAWSKI